MMQKLLTNYSLSRRPSHTVAAKWAVVEPAVRTVAAAELALGEVPETERIQTKTML